MDIGTGKGKEIGDKIIGHRDTLSKGGDYPGGRDHGTGIARRGTTSGHDSHRSSLLGLPQELIDLVIDQLANDGELHALQACCLTTSSWLPRIRSHLFGFVSLVPDKFAEFEERFRDSEAILYVRNLVIEGGTEDDDEEPVPRDGELSQGLLELFTNVENLRLSHMRWGKLRVDVQGYFLQGQPTLTVLQLTDVEFPKLTDLLNLARSYSELREIHLTRVVWSVEQGPGMISRRAYSPPKAPLHLEALSVYECTSPGAFVNSLLPPGYGGELRRISLEWGEMEDPTILRDLIRNAGSSLRSLAIDLSWQAGAGLRLDFRENTNLTDLKIDGLMLDKDNRGEGRRGKTMNWVPTLLSSVTSHQLRRVILNVTLSKRDIRERLQRFELGKVDDILAGGQFPSMKIVGVIVCLLPESDGREEALRTVVERMPKSHRRGVLCTTTEQLGKMEEVQGMRRG